MVISIFAFAPLALLVLRFHWLGLPGVWAALGCWMAARTVLLGRRWARAIADRRPAIGGRHPVSAVDARAELDREP
jgi:Na+-driven multidrug efflux pump